MHSCNYKVDDKSYRIDWDGPLPYVICDNYVAVSAVELPLMDVTIELCEQINPLAYSCVIVSSFKKKTWYTRII